MEFSNGPQCTPCTSFTPETRTLEVHLHIPCALYVEFHFSSRAFPFGVPFWKPLSRTLNRVLAHSLCLLNTLLADPLEYSVTLICLLQSVQQL